MKFKRNYKKGFTLVEILVVIAIGAVLTVLLLPGFTSARRYAQLDEDVTRTIIMIREAQEQSLYPNKDTLFTDGSTIISYSNFLCTTQFRTDALNNKIEITATYDTALNPQSKCDGFTSTNIIFSDQTLKYSTINSIAGIHFSTPFGEILDQSDTGSIDNSFGSSDPQAEIILSHTVDPTIQRRIIVKKSGIIDLQ